MQRRNVCLALNARPQRFLSMLLQGQESNIAGEKSSLPVGGIFCMHPCMRVGYDTQLWLTQAETGASGITR